MGFFNKILSGLQDGSAKPSGDLEEMPKQAKASPNRNASACPSCGAVFEKPPKRKVKCPECNTEVYIRSTQMIFPSNLLTKEDALAADFFKDLGAEVEDYENMRVKLKAKWGTEPSSSDVVWEVSNWLVTRPVASDVYDKDAEIMYRGKMIAFNQALYQLRRGKDPYPYLQNSNNYEVKLAALRGFNKISIFTRCCAACDKHQGEVYDTDRLLKNPILPFKECTRHLEKDDKYTWCACMYQAESNSLGV